MLIFLNVIPQKWASPLVFRAVVLVTFVFSIPDFLGFLIESKWLITIKSYIPFAQNNLGWVLPAIGAFFLINMLPFRVADTPTK